MLMAQLGKRGGKIGGKRRLETLSAEERRLLSAIANAHDDPLELAAKARIDPKEFLAFLEDMNLYHDESAKQLWVASYLMADSDLRPLLIGQAPFIRRNGKPSR